MITPLTGEGGAVGGAGVVTVSTRITPVENQPNIDVVDGTPTHSTKVTIN